MNSKFGIVAALVLALVIGAAGGTALNALQANAQTTNATSNVTQNQQPQFQQNGQSQPGGQFDPAKGGHVGANGKREELLTDDTAEKVKAAALAAVSGGTIERVETDAEGAAYEAHMVKSDGTRVTVKLDSNFKVTGTEDGMGQPNR